jgi:hypothetical protein
MHQTGGKQAVAGASEDYSDQWPQEEAKKDVGSQRDQHRCDGDLAEAGERQVDESERNGCQHGRRVG